MPLFFGPQQASRAKLPKDWFFLLPLKPAVHLAKMATAHERGGQAQSR